MLRLRLLVTIAFAVVLAGCGGASGRPTLPPPDYEEPTTPAEPPGPPAPDAGAADAA
jgi:hypothetical protein